MKEKYVKELQKCGKMFFIAATGGGTSFVGDFLKIPGGSQCIVGGYVPYAIEATNNFVGGKLDKYADANAARRLAVASYEHCLKLKVNEPNCVGVGVACSLVKDKERDGREHHINIAVHTYNETFGMSVVLKNSKLNRAEEEEFVNDLTLFVLANKYCKNIDREWEIIHQMIYLDHGGEATTFGEYNRMVGCDLYCDAMEDLEMQETIVIYPGSFFPLHNGHREIYHIAHKITELPVFYELSVTNSYKPSIDYVDLENRYKQFNTVNWLNAVILTKAPRFVDKVNLLKKHFNPKEIIIVVGADTWERVYDAAAHKNGDIKFFEDNNVKFLVFGRNAEIKNQDSVLFIKNDLALNYNNNISSTAIRKNQASA
jgi:nicotinic acid mononucleotide adenylyltransferase